MNCKLSSILSDSKICLLGYRILNLRLLTNRLLTSNFKTVFFKPKYRLPHFSVPVGSKKMSTNSTFLGKEDRFEGITVFSDHEPCELLDFATRLKNSLNEWRIKKKRGIWFKVHVDQCDWVPILVRNGFKYHHAKEEYVMLYLWLPTNESNNVPNYAHTMLGIGAVVINDKKQILVVQEKYFYKASMWKLPGGYVEPGENLVDAAIREVLEETGIRTEFKSILTLRHGHGGMFACSDLYVVVNLKAVSEDIEKCEREIAQCKWMDIQEYLGHPNVHDLNRFFVSKLLHHEKHNLKIDCFHGIHPLLNKPYSVYAVEKIDDDDAKVELTPLPPNS